MCGIAGVVALDGHRVDENVLLRMQSSVMHRGPDDAGIYAKGPVGFAHTRLSIIDVSAGHQPMCNEDGTIWIAYNGEVYNYRELQRRLEARGHVFRTSCDTEAIVHLYEEYGTDCVKHLNGMFAFAIWDEPRRRVFVRGISPIIFPSAATCSRRWRGAIWR